MRVAAKSARNLTAPQTAALRERLVQTQIATGKFGPVLQTARSATDSAARTHLRETIAAVRVGTASGRHVNQPHADPRISRTRRGPRRNSNDPACGARRYRTWLGTLRYFFAVLCPAARISMARDQVMGRMSAALAACQMAFFSAYVNEILTS